MAEGFDDTTHTSSSNELSLVFLILIFHLVSVTPCFFFQFWHLHCQLVNLLLFFFLFEHKACYKWALPKVKLRATVMHPTRSLYLDFRPSVATRCLVLCTHHKWQLVIVNAIRWENSFRLANIILYNTCLIHTDRAESKLIIYLITDSQTSMKYIFPEFPSSPSDEKKCSRPWTEQSVYPSWSHLSCSHLTPSFPRTETDLRRASLGP